MNGVYLKSQALILAELRKSILCDDKIVLLLGKSGLGKSFILQKFYENLLLEREKSESLFAYLNENLNKNLSENLNENALILNENLHKNSANFNENLPQETDEIPTNLRQNEQILNFKNALNSVLNLDEKNSQNPQNSVNFFENSPKNSQNSRQNEINSQAKNSQKANQAILSARIFYFSESFGSENALSNAISKAVFGIRLDFENLYERLKTLQSKIIFLFDETGVYDEILFERLRILGDLPKLCLILSSHKMKAIFNKEHFSSRISKTLFLSPLNPAELGLYAIKKHSQSLKNGLLKWLLRHSRANLRDIDKVFSTFDTLANFYKVRHKAKSQAYILKLATFHHGLLK